MGRVEIVVKLSCEVCPDEEAGVFVSRCPTLGLCSQGETHQEAVAAIQSAVGLYLTAAYRFDRLDLILRRAGFVEALIGGQSPLPETGEYVELRKHPAVTHVPIEVPLTLLAAQQIQARQRCQP